MNTVECASWTNTSQTFSVQGSNLAVALEEALFSGAHQDFPSHMHTHTQARSITPSLLKKNTTILRLQAVDTVSNILYNNNNNNKQHRNPTRSLLSRAKNDTKLRHTRVTSSCLTYETQLFQGQRLIIRTKKLSIICF